jgi:MerR family transcriptional regulator, copper efflux regulator
MALTIGKVAKAANVHVETLRYYKRRGLVPKPQEPLLYRRYPESTVRRVRFVRHAQAIGFSLREIRALLSLRAAPRARCADVKRRADTKLRHASTDFRHCSRRWMNEPQSRNADFCGV